jgi:hypothetical protein
MRLKNWAFSLFQPERILFQIGFRNVRPTPAIQRPGDDPLTPDLVAWDDSCILVIECCSGLPNQADCSKAQKYLNLPLPFYTKLTGISQPRLEVVLFYFEDKFNSAGNGNEGLREISVREEIVVWTCVPSI